MAVSGSVQFELADGTSVTVEADELRDIYQELLELTGLPGAFSTAELLVHEADQQPSNRLPVGLNGPQTVALRRALDHLAH